MKLSTQTQALEAAIYNWLKGNCFTLQSIGRNLLKIYYNIKLFQVNSLQSVPVYCIGKGCTHSEI